MPMINGDISSCSDTSDVSDDTMNSVMMYDSRNDICRDYLRNVCKRGQRCKYRHPSTEEAKNLGRQAQYTFCHDFQNSGCHRQNCKFMHCTREEEELYKQTGQLPVRLQQAAALGIGILPNKLPLDPGLVPVCKDNLKGECKRGNRCKFRHLSRPQYDALCTSKTKANNNHITEQCAPNMIIEPYINNHTENHQLHHQNSNPYEGEYELASKRRRIELIDYDYITLPHAFQGSLEEENLFLRRKVEILKKQVSDLIATNEVLLEQNARYRANKVSVATTVPPIVTVSQVVTPTITPAPTMVRQNIGQIQTSQQLTQQIVFEHHKSAEIMSLAQGRQPPILAAQVAVAQQQAQQTQTMNQPQPNVALAQQPQSNVIVPVTLTLDTSAHTRSMPTSVSITSALTIERMAAQGHPIVSIASGINGQQPQPIVSITQTSIPAPQLLASAHNPTLVSYPLISHAQQIPTSSMG